MASLRETFTFKSREGKKQRTQEERMQDFTGTPEKKLKARDLVKKNRLKKKVRGGS